MTVRQIALFSLLSCTALLAARAAADDSETDVAATATELRIPVESSVVNSRSAVATFQQAAQTLGNSRPTQPSASADGQWLRIGAEPRSADEPTIQRWMF
ncbi:hypothetical protein NVV93_00500 [Pseudomonas sp. LS44]|uniref:hypothetical protein n=1 Tax=Pseudomonas sp. LS44 TaxID=1357074 RepID=UPI00215AA57F|nr:hypothetical protein [Pseudomonas sp. LS44]UVE17915.1 hypothetical protein NVV93_00500 [Pseudomonas sp. LS44]